MTAAAYLVAQPLDAFTDEREAHAAAAELPGTVVLALAPGDARGVVDEALAAVDPYAAAAGIECHVPVSATTRRLLVQALRALVPGNRGRELAEAVPGHMADVVLRFCWRASLADAVEVARLLGVADDVIEAARSAGERDRAEAEALELGRVTGDGANGGAARWCEPPSAEAFAVARLRDAIRGVTSRGAL